MADARIGTTLADRYRIIDTLGTGGMGVVYRAERVGLGRPVAIKFLHPQMAREKELLARFEREARAMSRLQHPHCVPVIDFGVDADAPYIVLELVPGRSLRELLQESGALPPARAVRIARQVLAGLAHAHELGLVHRDVKPANIVLAEVIGSGDHARLLDFGLAKLVDDAAASWSAHTAVGTPSYMAPEQAKGEPVDARTDVYAVGVLLFEMLTGRKPFIGSEPMEILRQHLQDPAPRLKDLLPALPPGLDLAVDRALAKKKDDRHASAVAFSEALAPFENELERAAVVPSRAPRRDEAGVTPTAPVGRRRRRGMVLGILLVGGALGGAALLWKRGGAPAPVAPVVVGEPDAAPAPDAPPLDASPPDAPPPDAPPPDAPPPDAPPPDAPPPPDATEPTEPDAAPPDATP
jgi:serine/threonine-protein kinase